MLIKFLIKYIEKTKKKSDLLESRKLLDSINSDLDKLSKK